MTGPDVVVVGGGPAGSTAATLLARRGIAVTLLERDRFPRDHVGESLLPASMPILDALGVLPELEAEGYLKKWGATMVWGTTPESWSWYFRETNTQYPHAYQVWRPAFDHMLLRNAAASGAAVHEGCRARRVLFDGDRAIGVLATEADGGERRIEARHVVDASGQVGLIGRALGLRRVDAQFRNLAVSGYFDGAERLPEPDQTNIFIESFEHGWFWNTMRATAPSSRTSGRCAGRFAMMPSPHVRPLSARPLASQPEATSGWCSSAASCRPSSGTPCVRWSGRTRTAPALPAICWSRRGPEK